MSIPSNWTIQSDVKQTIKSVDELEIVPFLKENEKYIKSEELFKRAKEMNANLGYKDAEFILKHQKETPEEMKPYYLIFTGTILRDTAGNLYFAYLCWRDDHWCLDFDWLDFGWYGNDRLLRCKSLNTGSLNSFKCPHCQKEIKIN